MEEKKPIWKSKTIWINFIIATVAFFPSVKELLSADTVALVLTTVNVVLRLVTKDKIGLDA